MKIFKSLVYADRALKIPCFVAYVTAEDSAKAVALLNEELIAIPVNLFCGDYLLEVDDMPPYHAGLQLPTDSALVVLLRMV